MPHPIHPTTFKGHLHSLMLILYNVLKPIYDEENVPGRQEDREGFHKVDLKAVIETN